MDRAEKERFVADLRGALGTAEIIVLTHYIGMTVAEMGALRSQMRAVGAGYQVTKNRLLRLALDGTRFQALGPLLTGPTAIAYAGDPVVAAKVAVDYAKTNPKLVIVGASVGDGVLDADQVKALASLPSLDQLRGMIIGLVQAPAARLAAVLQAPAGQLARVVKAYAEEGGNA